MLKSMKSEMGSMYENKVWTLVDLPNDRKAIENKWIFKRKTDADSSITIYSLRSKLLVAEMDVSRTKIHLDTSIPATSNSERREYMISIRKTVFDVNTQEIGIYNV